jgi:hypothetical protein
VRLRGTVVEQALAAGLTEGDIVEAIRDKAAQKRRGSALPPVMRTDEAAGYLRRSTRYTRDYMVRIGVATKVGGRWEICLHKLKQVNPGMWLELELAAAGRR